MNCKIFIVPTLARIWCCPRALHGHTAVAQDFFASTSYTRYTHDGTVEGMTHGGMLRTSRQRAGGQQKTGYSLWLYKNRTDNLKGNAPVKQVYQDKRSCRLRYKKRNGLFEDCTEQKKVSRSKENMQSILIALILLLARWHNGSQYVTLPDINNSSAKNRSVRRQPSKAPIVGRTTTLETATGPGLDIQSLASTAAPPAAVCPCRFHTSTLAVPFRWDADTRGRKPPHCSCTYLSVLA